MPRVLLIDDDPFTAQILADTFKAQGYELETATTGAAGLALSLEKPPTLILLASSLPDQDGMETLKRIRGRARTADVPVMFLAGSGSGDRQNEALQAGADDFITRPFDSELLTLRIRNTINRRQREGLHHPQSGLPTGRLIQERIRALADEYGWYKIDFEIDNFLEFRDRYGFMSGQEVITHAADALSEAVEAAGAPEDFIGHRSDTEFVVITTLARGPALREEIEKRFNEGVERFYNFRELQQGYIEIDDGQGGLTHKPLMRARTRVQEGEPE